MISYITKHINNFHNHKNSSKFNKENLVQTLHRMQGFDKNLRIKQQNILHKIRNNMFKKQTLPHKIYRIKFNFVVRQNRKFSRFEYN